MTDWKKRARELFFDMDALVIGGPDAILQLGQEMADARAEEIARAVLEYKLMGCLTCPHQAASADAARIARSFISKKKTREEVLEEALKEISSLPCNYANPPEPRSVCIAKRALDWKPD